MTIDPIEKGERVFMSLLPQPPAKIVGGAVHFEGFDLAKLSDRDLEDVRGREIAMIFQDPMTSLNPTLKIGTQIMSFAGTGANTITAIDANALNQAGSAQQRASATTILSGLTPGSTTLTAKYKVSGGGAASCQFATRSIYAIPLS